MNIMERAYELAKSGEYQTLEDVGEQLKAEGYEPVEAHLSGLLTRRQIRSICSKASTKDRQRAKQTA